MCIHNQDTNHNTINANHNTKDLNQCNDSHITINNNSISNHTTNMKTNNKDTHAKPQIINIIIMITAIINNEELHLDDHIWMNAHMDEC